MFKLEMMICVGSEFGILLFMWELRFDLIQYLYKVNKKHLSQ